jgi:hypothetical protein
MTGARHSGVTEVRYRARVPRRVSPGPGSPRAVSRSAQPNASTRRRQASICHSGWAGSRERAPVDGSAAVGLGSDVTSLDGLDLPAGVGALQPG